MKSKHSKLRMRASGLYISHQYPMVGSSPDRILSCTCCGVYPLEVKNPYKFRELDITSFAGKSGTCLTLRNDEVKLDERHSYYIQCQTHMLTTGSNRCIFGLRTNGHNGLHVEIIYRNNDVIMMLCHRAVSYFQDVIVSELYFESFLKRFIVKQTLNEVLELVHKEISKAKVSTNSFMQDEVVHHADLDTAAVVEVVCEYSCNFCRKICVDEPVGPNDLSIECSKCLNWFHLSCVGLKPTDKIVSNLSLKWFCIYCKRET